MGRTARHLLPLSALLLAGVAHADAGVAQLAPAAGSAVLGDPDLLVRYELLPQGEPGRALLRGELDAAGTKLRTQVHIDPATPNRASDRVDLSVETPAPGPLRRMTIGDGYTGGAGWSAPSRLTGLRLGRLQAPRAALRADPLALPVVALPAPALDAAPVPFQAAPVPAYGDRWREEARRLAPPASTGAAAAPALGDPVHLGAGATDYEVEAGRLREGWDSADRRYRGHYGAAAWRAGVGLGLTVEARAERGDAVTAQGVELLQSLGGGASLQAVAAQSGSDGAGGAGGHRRGMALAGAGEATRWRLAYTSADREFRSAAGGEEAREGVRLETSYRWNAQFTAQAAVARTTTWAATEPESTLALGTDLGLGRDVRMRLDLARRLSTDPAWRAGVTVSVPLE